MVQRTLGRDPPASSFLWQHAAVRTWIKRQAGGALALAGIFSLALLALSVATDEGGLGWGVRFSRVVPLLPIPAAAGYALTLFRAARRGETLALEAIGIEPASWQKWVLLAALVPAALGAVALALGLDSSGLFPAASAAKACVVLAPNPAGATLFDCVQAGLRVQGSEVGLQAAPLATDHGTARGLAAGLTVALTGLVVVAWTGTALRRPGFGLLALALLLAETVICQAVGAGVLAPSRAVLLPLLGAVALVLTRARQTAMARVSSTRARA